METEINITDLQAKQSLEMIQQTTLKTKKAIDASCTSPWLILWGTLWLIAFGIAQFYLKHTALIFGTMGIVGGICSGVIVWWLKTKSPVKDAAFNPLDRKMWCFNLFLALYIVIWVTLLSPFNGFQLTEVIVTGFMFRYVVMGLFYESKPLVILGVFVTAVSMLAYFFFPHLYCLTMAIFGGGALLGTGIYIRLMWR
jgi:hypothetical protein